METNTNTNEVKRIDSSLANSEQSKQEQMFIMLNFKQDSNVSIPIDASFNGGEAIFDRILKRAFNESLTNYEESIAIKLNEALNPLNNFVQNIAPRLVIKEKSKENTQLITDDKGRTMMILEGEKQRLAFEKQINDAIRLQYKKEIDELKLKMYATNQELSDRQFIIDELQIERDELTEELERVKLRTGSKIAKSCKGQAKDIHAESLETGQFIDEKVKKLELELIESRNKCARLTSENKDLRAKNQNLLIPLKDSENKVNELTQQIVERTKNLKELESHASMKIGLLSVQIERLKEQKEELEVNLRERNHEIEIIKYCSSSADALENYKKQLNDSERSKQNLINDFFSMRRKNIELEDEIKELIEKSSAVENELKQRDNYNELIKSHIEEFKNTKDEFIKKLKRIIEEDNKVLSVSEIEIYKTKIATTKELLDKNELTPDYIPIIVKLLENNYSFFLSLLKKKHQSIKEVEKAKELLESSMTESLESLTQILNRKIPKRDELSFTSTQSHSILDEEQFPSSLAFPSLFPPPTSNKQVATSIEKEGILEKSKETSKQDDAKQLLKQTEAAGEVVAKSHRKLLSPAHLQASSKVVDEQKPPLPKSPATTKHVSKEPTSQTRIGKETSKES
jgi:hypothetical protein